MYVALSKYTYRSGGSLNVLQTSSIKKDKKLQERKVTFSVTKEVKDRTVLSDELASFCAKYPIFRLHVVPDTTVTDITKTGEKSEGKSK